MKFLTVVFDDGEREKYLVKDDAAEEALVQSLELNRVISNVIYDNKDIFEKLTSASIKEFAVFNDMKTMRAAKRQNCWFCQERIKEKKAAFLESRGYICDNCVKEQKDLAQARYDDIAGAIIGEYSVAYYE